MSESQIIFALGLILGAMGATVGWIVVILALPDHND